MWRYSVISKAIKKFIASAYDPTTVIGEFSGRDSVAAIMKALEDPTIQYILPIATFAGTEYGDFDVLYENYERMLTIVAGRFGETKTIYPLLEYSDRDLWALMNGRLIQMNSEDYGYTSPCIGCHLYFHLTKLPFAMALSGRIISGERASHDGRIKVNQLGLSLDAYQEVIRNCGGDLLMPIRELAAGDLVEELIGWQWAEGKDHPKCVLSGNYRDKNGQALYNPEKLSAYIKERLIPLGTLIGRAYRTTDTDIERLRKEVMTIL